MRAVCQRRHNRPSGDRGGRFDRRTTAGHRHRLASMATANSASGDAGHDDPRRRPDATAQDRSHDAIDAFVDALWLEDGLARLTLDAYRRDLRLCADWLIERTGRKLFAEPRLVPAPAFDRGLVDRLPDLPYAGGLDRARVALGRKAGLVPFEAEKGDQAPGFGLPVGDERLVLHFGEPIGRQRAAPVLHESLVLAVPEHEIAAIPDVPPPDVREVDRQTRVDGVPAAMDDARFQHRQGNLPQPL